MWGVAEVRWEWLHLGLGDGGGAGIRFIVRVLLGYVSACIIAIHHITFAHSCAKSHAL